MKTVLNNKTISLLSFDSDSFQSSYKLQELDKPIIQKLKATVEKLEKLPQVYLCARGDCFKTQQLHEEFIEEKLSKLFIVGNKAKYHLKNRPEKDIKFFRENATPSLDIKDEIISLIISCNEIIKNKPESHNISGQITPECQDFILKESGTNLQTWKLFFLSFLHNNGAPSKFKSPSPFISLTYGAKKISIARKFAFGRCRYSKGIIFIYSLNANFPYYFRSKDLTDQLKNYNVNWYKDVHHEIILINGMYPHFLIGVLEVTKNRAQKFILNPWIYRDFKCGNEFNYTEGVDIDQSNFTEFAEQLGYRSYFYHEIGRQMEFVSTLNNRERKQVFRV